MSTWDNIWDKNTPSEYWYYVAMMMAADNIDLFWSENSEEGLKCYIQCNDNFIGAADAEEISPDEAKFLYNNNYHNKHWREIMQWISDKRGYDKDMIWWIDRKRHQ